MADREESTQQWTYRVTSVKHESEDEGKVREHLDAQAAQGWELVNGCPVFWQIVFTPERDGRYVGGVVMSTGFVLQYFYWRKRVGG